MANKKFRYTLNADVIVVKNEDFYIDADTDDGAISTVRDLEGVVESTIKVTNRKRYASRCPRCHGTPSLHVVENGGYTLRCIGCTNADWGYHDSPIFYGKTEEEVYNAWETYVKEKEKIVQEETHEETNGD